MAKCKECDFYEICLKSNDDEPGGWADLARKNSVCIAFAKDGVCCMETDNAEQGNEKR